MWGNSFLVISIVKVDFNELEQILYAVHRKCFLVKIVFSKNKTKSNKSKA